jgi:hypothetical protein
MSELDNTVVNEGVVKDVKEDYSDIIKLHDNDPEWVKIVKKHKRAFDAVRKGKKLPLDVEDEILIWADLRGSDKDDKRFIDNLISVLKEAVEAEASEELVENEVENEEISEDADTEVTEAKDEEDAKEEVEETAPAFKTPSTKAGVINAAVEMLKKAKKHEALAMFAKMNKVDESEDDGSLDKVIADPKAKSSEVSAKAEAVEFDYSEDLDALVSDEATLSENFRAKAEAIFEATLKSKLSEAIERLEGEYAQNLEEEVDEIQSNMVEKVDNYLNYVVDSWMKENEVAVSTGLRTEIAEDFMASLQTVFKEHYIEVPEGKADLIDDMADQVAELEESLNKTTEENINLHQTAQLYERADIVREASSGLADTDAEKLASLVESIDFEDKTTFAMKVTTIKESYFKSDSSESVSEVDAVIGNDDGPVEGLSDSMSRYAQAITKSK